MKTDKRKKLYEKMDILVGADLFYDPVVAEVFATEVVLRLLEASTQDGKPKRKCLVATSIRNVETSLRPFSLSQSMNLFRAPPLFFVFTKKICFVVQV